MKLAAYLFIIFSSLLTFGLIAGVINFRDETYLEDNPLTAALTDQDFIPLLISDISPREYDYVCVFHPNGIDPRNWPMAQEGLSIRAIVGGSIPDDGLEGLYRIVLIDVFGRAEIWNFDERLFTIETVADPSALARRRGCLSFDNATLTWSSESHGGSDDMIITHLLIEEK
jgi:hypothetical protein